LASYILGGAHHQSPVESSELANHTGA